MPRQFYWLVLTGILLLFGCQESLPSLEVVVDSENKSVLHLSTQLQSLSTPEQDALREFLKDPTETETDGQLAEIAAKLRQLSISEAETLGAKLASLGATSVTEFALVPVQRQAAALDFIGRIRERVSKQLYTDIAHVGSVNFSKQHFPWLLQRTGQRVRQVIGLSLTWEPSDRGAEPTDVYDDDLKAVAALTGLESLVLEHTQITDSGLNHLLTLRNLKSLNLNDTHVTDEGLRFISELPSLAELKLVRTDIAGPGIQFLSKCQNLTTLEFVDGSKVDLSSINQLKSLRHLNVAVDGDFDVHSLPNLVTLSVHLVDDEGSQKTFRLSDMPLLEKISVYIRYPLDERFKMANLPKLKSLDLSGGFAAFPFEQIGQFTNLRVLYIRSHHNQTCSKEDVQNFSELRLLENFCLRINVEPGCVETLRHFTSLQALEIWGQVGDTELPHLMNMQLMRELTLVGTHGTGQGFEVLKQMPQIKSVTLRNVEIDSLRLASIPSLTHLNVMESSIRNVDVRLLPDLVTLNIDAEVESISIHDVPKLSWLYLKSHTPEVDIGELPALKSHKSAPFAPSTFQEAGNQRTDQSGAECQISEPLEIIR